MANEEIKACINIEILINAIAVLLSSDFFNIYFGRRGIVLKLKIPVT